MVQILVGIFVLMTIARRIAAEYPWTFDNDLFGGTFLLSLKNYQVLMDIFPALGLYKGPSNYVNGCISVLVRLLSCAPETMIPSYFSFENLDLFTNAHCPSRLSLIIFLFENVSHLDNP